MEKSLKYSDKFPDIYKTFLAKLLAYQSEFEKKCSIRFQELFSAKVFREFNSFSELLLNKFNLNCDFGEFMQEINEYEKNY